MFIKRGDAQILAVLNPEASEKDELQETVTAEEKVAENKSIVLTKATEPVRDIKLEN